MYGIENLKKVIDAGLAFADDFRTILADKKFQVTELILLVDNVSAITEIVQNWKLIIAEFKDLVPTEREGLNTHFAQKFDIPNDKVEEVIELSLTFTVSGVVLIEKMRDLKKQA